VWNLVPRPAAAEAEQTSGARQRADRLLVERGLFESRAKAQAAIEAGLVSINDLPLRKASELIPIGAELRATAAYPYVSRGGVKLAAALDHFAFDPNGRVCLDVGASTGGFTDVLLKRGAKRVYAVDVGHGQLHRSLRDRPDVILFENTDIRAVLPAQIRETPDLVAVDVSFISLKLVLPIALKLVAHRTQLVALIKPQFEAGRDAAKKGIVRDEIVRNAVRDDISAFVASLGWRVLDVMPSPIPGGDGNAEFLLGAVRD
jgi:23S rRNA (cytidine1920-2'-O)/16S rRNA (cytidine1409-2'-O)-methyltransferase